MVARLDAGVLHDEKTGGRRKGLHRLRLQEGPGPPDHLLKVNRYQGGTGWRRRWRGSKARHELATAEACAARGLPTPLPLAAGEERHAGRLVRCLLLVPILADVTDLRALWYGAEASLSSRDALPRPEQRALARAFGQFCRQVHEAGLFQEDSATNNFLVRRAGGQGPAKLWIIDFERARLQRRTSTRQRRVMLTKLHRDLSRSSATDRWRFLTAYTGGDRAEARHCWQALAREASTLAAHDLRRMARTCLSGRRYRRLAQGTWRGFGRRDVALQELVTAREGARRAAGSPSRQGMFWCVSLSGPPRRLQNAWVMINFLYVRRGLAPKPLALWMKHDVGLLLLAAEPGDRLVGAPGDAAAAQAQRALLRTSAALGEISDRVVGLPYLWRPAQQDGGEALWLRPEGLRVRGRPTALELLDEVLART